MYRLLREPSIALEIGYLAVRAPQYLSRLVHTFTLTVPGLWLPVVTRKMKGLNASTVAALPPKSTATPSTKPRPTICKLVPPFDRPVSWLTAKMAGEFKNAICTGLAPTGAVFTTVSVFVLITDTELELRFVT